MTRSWQGDSQARKRLAKNVESSESWWQSQCRVKARGRLLSGGRRTGEQNHDRSREREEASLGNRAGIARAKANRERGSETTRASEVWSRSAVSGKKTPAVCLIGPPKRVGGRETHEELVSTSRKWRKQSQWPTGARVLVFEKCRLQTSVRDAQDRSVHGNPHAAAPTRGTEGREPRSRAMDAREAR